MGNGATRASPNKDGAVDDKTSHHNESNAFANVKPINQDQHATTSQQSDEQLTEAKPFRKLRITFDESGFEDLRLDLIRLKPSGKLQHMNIAVVGRLAAGKSSFINTISSAFTGYFVENAVADSDHKSVTQKLSVYQHESSYFQHIRLFDTAGLADMADKIYGLKSKDFKYVLKGHIKEGYKFVEGECISERHALYRTNPELQHEMHCVCFVIDGNDDFISETDEIAEFLKNLKREYDLRFVILLTHMDLACSAVNADPSSTYKSKRVKYIVEEVAAKLNVAEREIVPVVNHIKEVEISHDINVLALLALRQMLRHAKGVIERKSK